MLTLAETAYLADAPAKWVLNTCAALGERGPYTLALARRLYVVRLLQRTAGCTVERANALAGQLLHAESHDGRTVSVPLDAHGMLVVQLDAARLDSSFAVRRSVLRTTVAPQVRGRTRSQTRRPLDAAREWGLDLSLLASNLRRTPAERLRQLDAMAAFRRRVRRTDSPESA